MSQHQEVGTVTVSGTGHTIVFQQGSSGNVPAISPSNFTNPQSIVGQRSPTRASLRALLGEVLRTSSDVQSFLIDWFPDVASRISGGMTRDAIENLLFQIRDTDEILAKLREHDATRVNRYESLLKWSDAG
jgi:hypothetical protein